MLFDNREQVVRQLGQVSAFLDGLASALRGQDIDALVAHFQRARDLRTALLDRDLLAHRREFPADGDHRAEVAYLMELGAAGGYLTGCRVDGDRVGYTGHLPETADAA